MIRFLLTFLLILTGCLPQKKWVYREVASNSPQFESAYLHYPPENELNGVGIELITGQFGTIGHLNVICRQIPLLHEDKAVVAFVIEDETYTYQAVRMEGGQRLLLPDEATEKLIDSLINDQPVTIYLDGYTTIVQTSNFTKDCRKFCRRLSKPSVHPSKAQL